MRVLVVEDDERLADVLVRGLTDAGHDVTLRRNGPDGLDAAMADAGDVVLLDWMLPGQDGPSVCRELRARGNHTPILMLTARHDVPDRISGLDAGADDYLTKPFGLTELLARIRAHQRRRSVTVPDAADPVVAGDLVVDVGARRCAVAGQEVTLRAKEFDLLARLVTSLGVALRRETLMADVWDENWYGSTKTLDVHIAALRRQLMAAAASTDPPARLPEITTLRGYGYRIEPVA
jgi:DNA-binding response OmpR family regulator